MRKSSKEKRVFLWDTFANLAPDKAKPHFLGGVPACYLCWMTAHGVPRSYYFKCKKSQTDIHPSIAMSRDDARLRGGRRTCKVSQRMCLREEKCGTILERYPALTQADSAAAFISITAATTGDYIPNKEEVQLPVGTKKDLYRKYKESSSDGVSSGWVPAPPAFLA